MGKETEDMQFYCYCASCGNGLHEYEYRLFEDDYYCEDCLEERTFVCDRCGERFSTDDDEGDGNTQICQRCYEYHYTNCDRCGRIISTDDAYYDDDDDDNRYCYSCYENHVRNAVIRGYNYKPFPMFYGDGPRFMGVELEVDGGGQSSRNAGELYEIANGESERIYIKHDGSLENGFEIVTHPMSLDYHRRNMPWKRLVERASEMDYLSHKTETCGLHVHVSRNCFGDDCVTQELKISKVLYIIERFWAELLLFSRRTEEQLAQWAQRYGYEETPKHILDKAKINGNRYRCINLENADTIEFRIFRGTLNYNTIIAALEMVDVICDMAVTKYDYELAELAWRDFTDKIDSEKYPELIAYLKERRLYVEPPLQ